MSNFDELILDVKIIIAEFDEFAWFILYRFDESFHNYSLSESSQHRFIELFTQRKKRKFLNITNKNLPRKHIANQIDSTATYLFGKLHSIYDQPSRIDVNGGMFWHYRGCLHRSNDLPAVIIHEIKVWMQYFPNSEKIDTVVPQEVYKYGAGWSDQYESYYHRINNLPAIIVDGYCKCWYEYCELHRSGDLPVIIYNDGHQEWRVNNKIHRNDDLPAIISNRGLMKWFRNDIEYNPW